MGLVLTLPRFMPWEISEILILSSVVLLEELGRDICRIIALKIYSVHINEPRNERKVNYQWKPGPTTHWGGYQNPHPVQDPHRGWGDAPRNGWGDPDDPVPYEPNYWGNDPVPYEPNGDWGEAPDADADGGGW